MGVGWFVFTRGSDFYWMRELDGRYLFWSSVIAGVASFLLLRVLTHWVLGFSGLFSCVSRIFGRSEGKGIVGLVVSFFPAVFLLTVFFQVLRLAGAVEGLDGMGTAVLARPGAPPLEPSLIQKGVRWVTESDWSDWLRSVDPIGIAEGEKLGKILLVSQDAKAWRYFEDDSACRELLKNIKFRDLLWNVQKGEIITKKNQFYVFQNKKLMSVARDPEVRLLLEKIEVDKLIDSALYEKPKSGGNGHAPEFSIPLKIDREA